MSEKLRNETQKYIMDLLEDMTFDNALYIKADILMRELTCLEALDNPLTAKETCINTEIQNLQETVARWIAKLAATDDNLERILIAGEILHDCRLINYYENILDEYQKT